MKENTDGYRIADLDVDERPRERLAKLGPSKLRNEELLAILLRVGVPGESAVQVGKRLLDNLGGLTGIYQASFKEICSQHGIGPAKAAQIQAALELGRRISESSEEEVHYIHSPEDVFKLLRYRMGALEQEEMRVVLLDTRNRVLEDVVVYRGSLNSAQVRVGEIFKHAIRRNAAAVILVHNHPSGDPNPSPDDVAVTRAIVQAGKLMDIDVLDHIVIGRGRYTSLKQRGLGFTN
ncbi:MAG: DNA repair protein RadC [Chloroflexi bacterium]|jgi:DNA repair protein RadC|nr:DNA repair protein RadC [Chloroflexota bacterium]